MLIYCLLAIVLVRDSIVTTPLERVPISIDLGDHYFGSARDLLIDGTSFYLVENREHRIHKLKLDGTKITYVALVADKGEGPGEIWLPSRIVRVPDTGFAVLDNRGISLFDHDGRFSNRFRVFTPNLSMTAIGDEIFFLTTRVDSGSDMIDVYTTDGTRDRSFFREFMTVDSTRTDPRSLVSNKAYMLDGPLLTDGVMLFYFSNTTGRLASMDP